MNFEMVKEVSILIAVVGTITTLIIGLVKFRLYSKQKHFERFQELRRKLTENEKLRQICDYLDFKDPKIETVDYKDKYDFIGIFEDITIMMNSGLIKKEIVYYMLAYYAIRCSENDPFWKNINRQAPYWRLFHDFALQMKELEKKNLNPNSFNRNDYTL